MIIACITGPTGVGKSQLVVDLAQKFDAEIIGCDSRQIYQDVSIGVASPNSEQIELVNHHLVGFLPIQESYSVGRFYRDIQPYSLSDKPYILVGGTGFYVKAIQQGLNDIPDIQAEVRDSVRQFLEVHGIAALREKANKIDPKAVLKVATHDTHRLSRIVEVYEQTQKTWSSYLDERLPSLFSASVFQLDRPRPILYERINERVLSMIEMGWVEEVRSLLDKGYNFQEPGLNALGYKEIAQELSSNMDKTSISQVLLDKISQKTRNYAKRQITFLRTQIHDLSLINLESPSSFDEITEKMKKKNFF